MIINSNETAFTASSALADSNGGLRMNAENKGIMIVAEKRYYSTKELAIVYGLTDARLRKLRQLQKGPKYRKLGRSVCYTKADVEEWLDKAMITIEPKGVI